MQNTKSCLDAQAMIALIQGAYQTHNRWAHKNVPIKHETLSGAFSKPDEDACKRCKELNESRGTKKCDDEIVANYDVGSKAVHFIDIEEVFKSIPRRQGKVCDFMFYAEDMSRFVLNELTCMDYAYIFSDGENQDGKQRIAKRTKARTQLKTIIEELLSMPETKEELDKFVGCIALFSYRIKDLEQIPADKHDPISSMGGFIQATIPTNSLRATENLTDRFVWEERRYPEVFKF